MDTRHPGFTTLQTIRPEITMNINTATICPEITRIRLVQNLISHLVDHIRVNPYLQPSQVW